ncbi:MAG: ABC transporter permease [bacterium]|nr:ABC transporter permease [bacterium]
MKASLMIYKNSFVAFLKQISQDYMLFAAVFAPLLAGMFIRFGVPFAEELLIMQFHRSTVLSPYYKMIDLLLSMVTPLMAGFISAMVMLGEKDDCIISYLAVTPLGKKGYLISRLLIPSLFAAVIGFVICILFQISTLSPWTLAIISIFTTALGGIICLFIVSMSSNKVEGMAIGKLSGIVLLGVFVPFFFHSWVQYIAVILPSYSIGKYVTTGEGKWLVTGGFLTLFWFILLYRRFIKHSFY